MKLRPLLFCVIAALILLPISVLCQSWQPLTHQPSFQAGTALLLTDGTVFVQEADNINWWRLTPDLSGSYVNGTWTQLASTPGFGPLYYASAVLADGRVFVMGGEYNLGYQTEQATGYLYSPSTNKWSSLAPPPGWNYVGDAPCTVLQNGKVLMGNIFNTEAAILDPKTLNWTPATAGKVDNFGEEGFALLPDSSVLTIDIANTPNSERYVPTSNLWTSAGSTPSLLVNKTYSEVGPLILRYDGSVLALGATGHAALYSPPSVAEPLGSWTAAPDIPLGFGSQLDVADGPAAILPSGNVLFGASWSVYKQGTQFFEFDGANFITEPNPPSAVSDSSYYGCLLVLPTGQVLRTNFSTDIEIYTPGGFPKNAWRPAITTVPTTVSAKATYTIRGTQFNGLSQGSAYGDDVSNATNYPIVRVTNLTTGRVTYARTSNHSTMGVATGPAIVSTRFTLPGNVDSGPANLEVVANGIPSLPALVNVVSFNEQSLAPSSVLVGSTNVTVSVIGNGFVPSSVVYLKGVAVSTNYVSERTLTFTLPDSYFAATSVASVKVVNPGPLSSNSLNFMVGNPIPALSSIYPPQIPADGVDTTITLTGKGFIPKSKVSIPGAVASSKYISSTKLQATIKGAYLNADSIFSVYVTNPSPGGGSTNFINLTVGGG